MNVSLRYLAPIALALCLAGPAAAEQMQPIGGFEAHYSVVPTTFLRPEIAASYDVTRGRDRAILDAEGVPVRAEVSGVVRNLLEQVQPLEFRQVVEGVAVYYLAEVKHTDREVLRFALQVETPDGGTHDVRFNQKMYWEGR